jgi:DNA polymerase-3 subunit alpha
MVEEFPKKELLLYEKEILGMCFSGHILDSYTKHISSLAPTPLAELLNKSDIQDKSNVKVVGLITQRSIKKTKNDENMAFIKLSDSCGEIEVIVFPKTYLKYSSMLQADNVIYVNGQISINDEQEPKIIANTIENVLQNSEYEKTPKQKNGKLYLKVSSINSNIVTEIITLLKEYSGETDIVFYDVSEKKYVKATGVKITVNDSILSALKMILGPDAVVFKE